MAGFDRSLDEEIYGEEVKFETSKLRVSVFSYNQGIPKLQISRKNLNQTSGDFIFSKLGRLTKDEVEAILPLIQKAYETMNNYVVPEKEE